MVLGVLEKNLDIDPCIPRGVQRGHFVALKIYYDSAAAAALVGWICFSVSLAMSMGAHASRCIGSI